MAVKKTDQVNIRLKPLNISEIEVKIRGFDGPLVVHNWSTKAITEMLTKQMSSKAKEKTKKDPQQAYEDSLYYIGTGKEKVKRYGFPATAFKSAMIRAVKILKDTGQLKLDMIAAKQMLFVMPDGVENREIEIAFPTGEVFRDTTNTEVVEIHGEPSRRMDMVRLSSGVADIRFRAEFRTWTAKLKIQYNADVLDDNTVANLLYRAGMTVGIGEGRPEKGDMGWGRFEIIK